MESGSLTFDLESPENRAKPIFEDGKYKNPWSTYKRPSLGKTFKFVFCTKSHANIPGQQELAKTLPVLKPDLSQFNVSPGSGIRHMWVGHATSLVQFDGITLLTDPMFSVRNSPSQSIGAKRYRPTPCTIAELPKVDCVVISHNHYDHLDYNSVVALNERFGKDLQWLVPMGLKQWMKDAGVTNVVEMTWWEERSFNDVKFICTPCQHWSKRTLTDDFTSLWCSWCVIGPKHKFFFAGDTGYCAAFKQIGHHVGPFHLATIPIGAYTPRWMLECQHTDPAEAVSIHSDVKARVSIGIHWGTFPQVAKEFYLEPREKVKEVLQERNMKADEFITTSHGEIVVVEGGSIL